MPKPLSTAHLPQVQYWAPASAGAGVTLVMAYLNGNHIPNLLRLSTLITKFVGTVCSVSAGLPMGPEVRMRAVVMHPEPLPCLALVCRACDPVARADAEHRAT